MTSWYLYDSQVRRKKSWCRQVSIIMLNNSTEINHFSSFLYSGALTKAEEISCSWQWCHLLLFSYCLLILLLQFLLFFHLLHFHFFFFQLSTPFFNFFSFNFQSSSNFFLIFFSLLVSFKLTFFPLLVLGSEFEEDFDDCESKKLDVSELSWSEELSVDDFRPILCVC